MSTSRAGSRRSSTTICSFQRSVGSERSPFCVHGARLRQLDRRAPHASHLPRQRPARALPIQGARRASEVPLGMKRTRGGANGPKRAPPPATASCDVLIQPQIRPATGACARHAYLSTCCICGWLPAGRRLIKHNRLGPDRDRHDPVPVPKRPEQARQGTAGITENGVAANQERRHLSRLRVADPVS